MATIGVRREALLLLKEGRDKEQTMAFRIYGSIRYSCRSRRGQPGETVSPMSSMPAGVNADPPCLGSGRRAK